MHIAIVEDEKYMQNQIYEKLQTWKNLHRLSLDVSIFDSGASFLEDARTNHYQIVLMDIYIGSESGIDTALKYREIDINALLIFLTSSQNHMKEAFPCRAFDYLVKPVEDSDLFHTLDEAMRTFTPVDGSLTIPKGDIKYSIHYSDIRYVTAQRNYCTIESNETLSYRTTFQHIADELGSDPRFCLINRGILVNLDWVNQFENGKCIMKDGTSFPLHTKKQTQLTQKLIDYRFLKRTTQIRRMWDE